MFSVVFAALLPLAEAVVDAGAVRFRPMLLTAMAGVVGASVILADPVFKGLAIALMAGETAGLLVSRHSRRFTTGPTSGLIVREDRPS